MPKTFFGVLLHQLPNLKSAVEIGRQNSMIDELVDFNNDKRNCA